ncbi:hypothetical protein ACN267_25405 [Micromonospora sp. WMMD734]|uniref:hypothetical protein n=1 Tax=Micromonospora sp. WMMD734 TaxID=3404129 RepID=UPI003B951AA3
MARHAKNPAYSGLLVRCWWPFGRRRVNPLDRLRPATNHAERVAAYRVTGVARVPDLPERPLLTLAGEYRAGCWS